MGYRQHIVAYRCSYREVCCTGLVKYRFGALLVDVANLNYNCRVFSEQDAGEVFLTKAHLEAVGIEIYTSFYVGEAHFKKGRHKTACANVVNGIDISLTHKSLNGIEVLLKMSGINIRGILPYFAHSLSKGGASEFKRARAEIDII